MPAPIFTKVRFVYFSLAGQDFREITNIRVINTFAILTDRSLSTRVFVSSEITAEVENA
jgi:hypothetical protein